jgi:GTPase SAR1 family protein
LICFSLEDDAERSFENVYQKWVPEITNNCPNVPYILCGTKLDSKKNNELSEKVFVFVK